MWDKSVNNIHPFSLSLISRFPPWIPPLRFVIIDYLLVTGKPIYPFLPDISLGHGISSHPINDVIQPNQFYKTPRLSDGRLKDPCFSIHLRNYRPSCVKMWLERRCESNAIVTESERKSFQVYLLWPCQSLFAAFLTLSIKQARI